MTGKFFSCIFIRLRYAFFLRHLLNPCLKIICHFILRNFVNIDFVFCPRGFVMKSYFLAFQHLIDPKLHTLHLKRVFVHD
ncbi:hypothetical protein BGS_0522 [Beggiatoa sp. SS]|nr:hypothetical protein BGS_0522 [Beggiatoa sp. SS]